MEVKFVMKTLQILRGQFIGFHFFNFFFETIKRTDIFDFGMCFFPSFGCLARNLFTAIKDAVYWISKKLRCMPQMIYVLPLNLNISFVISEDIPLAALHISVAVCKYYCDIWR